MSCCWVANLVATPAACLTVHPRRLQAAAAAQEAPTQGDDVYAYEPQPLEQGVRKHMLSVFVAGARAGRIVM